MDIFFSSPCFIESALKLAFKAFHTHHETTHTHGLLVFSGQGCCLQTVVFIV